MWALTFDRNNLNAKKLMKKNCFGTTSTSTSTLFHKTIGYNRLARKIAIANLGGPVKRKINWKEKKGKEKEEKLP